MPSDPSNPSNQQKQPRLAGKVAVVTGAGSSGPGLGTGKATAILFAREGAKVVLVDRDASRVEETLTIIRSEGGEASVHIADITRAADCEQIVEIAKARYGGLHILVNNVAAGSRGTVVDVSEDDWDRVIEVNLKGTMLTSKYAIPAMIASGGGSIINISSIDAMRAGSGTIAPIISYSASKGGINALTTSMAVHHGRDNIRVNAIAPGFIHTPIASVGMKDEMRELRRTAGPLGTEGTAWDVAWAAVFLASDEARWITGIILPVDAGLLATTSLCMVPFLN